MRVIGIGTLLTHTARRQDATGVKKVAQPPASPPPTDPAVSRRMKAVK